MLHCCFENAWIQPTIFPQILNPPNLAGGIVWRVDDNQLGLGRKGGGHLLPVEMPIWGLQGQHHRLGAGALHDRHIRVVQRRKQNDLERRGEGQMLFLKGNARVICG